MPHNFLAVLSQKFALTLLIILGPLFVGTAKGCPCEGDPPPPYAAMLGAKAVFVGTVTGFRDDGEKNGEGNRIFQVRVDEKIKGISTKAVEVNAGYSSSMCFVGFKVGEAYLIYADGHGQMLSSGMCSRSGPLKSNMDELLFLRSFVKGKPEPRIYGSVRRAELEPKSNTILITYMPGFLVTVEGAGKKLQATSDKNGLFSFDDLPDGEYHVKVDAPSIYDDRGLDWTVTLGSTPKGYVAQYEKASYVDFSLSWNNGIRGKILDAEGKPIQRAIVRLLAAEHASDKLTPNYQHISDYLGDDGKYVIGSRSPGRYVLVVELLTPFGVSGENYRQYFPNSFSPEKAEVLQIGAPDKRNLDLRLSGLISRTIEGIVTWPDGTPVEGGNVLLDKLANVDDPKNTRYDITFPKEGKFSLQAFEGGDYWISVHGNYDSLRNKFPDKDYVRVNLSEIESTPVLVKVTKNMQPLKIVIPFPRSIPGPK